MERLNYGLALDNKDWAVIDTIHGPGIRDDYTRTAGRTFAFFVAPAEYVDQALGLDPHDPNYREKRLGRFKHNPSMIKQAILAYHGAKERKPKPTWSSDHFPREETEWVEIPVYKIRNKR